MYLDFNEESYAEENQFWNCFRVKQQLLIWLDVFFNNKNINSSEKQIIFLY